MSDSISDLLQETVDRAASLSQAAWDSLVPPGSLDNLHDLPAHVHATLSDLVDKLTLRQGVPNPRDWLPDVVNPAAAASPAPPPPPPPHSRFPWLADLAGHARAHPLSYTVAAIGLSGGAAYVAYPAETTRVLAPLLTRLVPLALLPDPKHRPLRLVPGEHGVAHEVRKEAVVVLGADSPHGRDLALDLERRGFVVVATVSDPREVDVLEKLGRGWLKVLVLDPNEVRVPWHSARLRQPTLTRSLVVVLGRTLPALALDGAFAAIPAPHPGRPFFPPGARPRPDGCRQLPLARRAR